MMILLLQLTLEKIASHNPPGEFAVSPDGKRIAYVLDERIYVMPLGGKARAITDEEGSFAAPTWAPDGKRLAAEGDGEIWIMNDDGSDAEPVTDHGAGHDSPSWSPDGEMLAFYSRRNGYDHIWVLGEQLRQVTTSPFDNYDSDEVYQVQWSPDGRRFAYVSDRTDDLYNSDVYVCPVEGGEERCLTVAKDSYDWAPRWSPDGKKIAYVSDIDGWARIWVMNADGTDRKPLSTGDFEDDLPAWSPDGSKLCFARNRAGMIDLMVMPLDGKPVRVTQSDGHWTLVSWLGDRLAATLSSPTCPGDLFIVGDKEERVTDSRIAGAIAPERVSFKSRDGLTIFGYLYKSAKGGRRPALVNPHGGPTAQYLYEWDPFAQFLAQEGYVVLCPDVRGSTGYGRAFQRANDREWGNKDLLDLVDAAAWLRARDDVDGRVGIFGESYGGYLTLCALTMAPEVFACGIDMYGDSDLDESWRLGDRGGRLDLEREMGKPSDLYRQRSPVTHVEKMRAPLLMLHGRQDARVVPRMTELMAAACDREGKFYEAHFYDEEEHGFFDPKNVLDSNRRMTGFLDRYLKGASK